MGRKIRIRKCRVCKKIYKGSLWKGCCSEECLKERKIVLNKKKEINPVRFDPQSRRWLGLRYKVLQMYGRQCQCCGAMPPDAIIQVDHIKPRSKYPELTWDINNLQVLCKECNQGKLDLSEEDFRTQPDFLTDVMKNYKP